MQHTLTCKVLSFESLTKTIYRVCLTPDKIFDFRPGQYLLVVLDEDNKYPFSLASTPMDTTSIELHIGISEPHGHTIAVMHYLMNHRHMIVDAAPGGNAWLRENTNRPILLIAGGTGFSYTRSILLTVLYRQPQRDVALYWGGRTREQLYDLHELERLAFQHPTFSLVTVVEEPDALWQGRTGTVLTAVMQDFITLSPFDIYIAGSLKMVQTAKKIFCTEYHACKERIFSDAFDFI